MKDYRLTDELDVKLQLLSGSPIRMDGLIMPQHTLKEIVSYGYSDYMYNLQLLSITVEEFIKNIQDIEKRMMLEVEKSNLKTYDFFMTFGGIELQEDLLNAISMVFKTDDIRIIEGNIIAINFINMGIMVEDENGDLIISQENLETIDETDLQIIHKDNFDDFVQAVKILNYLSKPKADKNESNPADEETRALMEHMEKMRKKVEEKKKKQGNQDDEGDIDVADIISAVSSKSNSINKLNIWDLTIYQLYDEYSRLELIDNYEFSVKAMMAGASKVDLKHWSSRI